MIKPIQVIETASPFTKQKILHAKILRFGDRSFAGIHPRVSIPLKKRSLSYGNQYLLSSVKLTRKKDGKYFAMLTKETVWQKQAPFFSFIPYRNQVSTYLKKQIQNQYQHPLVKALLISLFTGNRSHFFLNATLQEVGLTHLIAISGLHFSILIGILSLCISKLRSLKVKGVLIAALSSILFLYFGPSPPVLRAYSFCLLYVLSLMLNKSSNALNTLGIALFFQLILWPHAIHSLSLQLSFLATFALLFFTPLVERFLFDVFPDPPLELDKLSLWKKTLFALSVFSRKTLSINFSVHLFLVPFLLYRFHFFPLSSFYLNLWIPFCIAIGMQLMLMGLIFPPIHTINEFFLEKIFYLIEYRNLFFRIFFTRSPSFEMLITIYFVLFFLGIRHYERSKQQILFYY